jgi:hypothetical protein
MQRSLILMAAAVFSLVACTDVPKSAITAPNDPRQPILPTPSTLTLSGRISVTGLVDYDRKIELWDGSELYRLVGSQSSALASVDGADVVVRGTFDANPGFVVEEFQVTGMLGRPALDGVLEAIDEGFALRLSDGSLRVVPTLTSECAEFIGNRLWIIGFEEGSEVVFGRIAAL